MSTITALRLLRPSITPRCLNALPTPSSSSSSSSSAAAAAAAAAQFSTTTPAAAAFRRINRDRSKLRGVSAIRRQPKKIALAAAKFELPQPVLDMQKHHDIEVDPEHGLWGFFYEKKALPTPVEDSEHGRAWTAEELRAKSWEDLHKLWWVCAKELNIMATQKLERERLDPGDGAHEAQARRIQIKNTQRGIKHVLTERYYAWQEAQEIAKTDKSVDMSGNGPAFVPELEESFEQEEEAEAPPATKPTTL